MENLISEAVRRLIIKKEKEELEIRRLADPASKEMYRALKLLNEIERVSKNMGFELYPDQLIKIFSEIIQMEGIEI